MITGTRSTLPYPYGRPTGPIEPAAKTSVEDTMTLAPALTALRERRREIVHEHIDAENRHDATGTVETFAHPCYDIVPLGAMLDGADAVHGFWDGNLTGFPDLHLESGPYRHLDDGVFVEVRLTGTHQGDWAGIPATGRAVDVRIGCLYEFDADRLVCERIYFDMAIVLRQLGVLTA
jgi:steroid delta-isomerase-like uncharacterized protein